MNPGPPPANGLALKPVDEPGSERDAAPRQLGITNADSFLEQAANEYEDGRVDQALWARASKQSGDDESLVIAAYLRARATALRLQQRNNRSQARAPASSPDDATRDRRVHAKAARPPGSERRLPGPRSAVGPNRKYMLTGAAAIVSVVAAVWLIPSLWREEPARPPAVSAASASRKPPASSPVAASTQRAAQIPSGSAGQTGLEPGHEPKVQALKKAGNWHVLVLYAADWTRKQPDNGVAWKELSIGYAKLRQFDDALDAASRAAERAPEDASVWRNLGYIHLTLERLPDAELAFNRALALRADEVDALCGAATVAQKQARHKDAEAIAKRVKSLDASCDGNVETAPATTVSARQEPVLTVRR